MNFFHRAWLTGIALTLPFLWVVRASDTNASAALTAGWKPVPFKYDIQHPYDLQTSDRYDFDATSNTHHFWVYFKCGVYSRKDSDRSEVRIRNIKMWVR